MWTVSALVALIVTAVTLAYAAFLPQISGESPGGWLGLAALVFIPWFSLSALFQHVRRIEHLGVSRLFQLAALVSAVYGVATSGAMNLPTVAAYFAAYGLVALVISVAVWWVVQGFAAHRNK